jgi:hypothetical protein
VLARTSVTDATLAKYRDIVFQTADFMASYATWDTNTSRYVLGPVLQCAQEIFPKDNTFNPDVRADLLALGIGDGAAMAHAPRPAARARSGTRYCADLARPPVADGKYLFAETTPDCYTNPKWNADHPSVTGALSFVPGPGVDAETMRNTLDWVWKNWNWPDTWGWDYPMLAMTAARLGEPERAD